MFNKCSVVEFSAVRVQEETGLTVCDTNLERKKRNLND